MIAREPAAPTARTTTFDLLRSRGITTVLGIPGSTEFPTFRDLPDDFRHVEVVID